MGWRCRAFCRWGGGGDGSAAGGLEVPEARLCEMGPYAGKMAV